MSETAATAAPAAGTEGASTETAAEAPTPPWGSDEEFNPEKAWNLIENLRADKGKLTPEVEELRGKVKEFEDAKLSTEEKAARDLTESQQTIGTLSAENAVLKAVIAHPELSADDIELLEGLPADAIESRAAKLAARLGSAAPKNTLTNRPGELPRGGSDPTTPVSESRDWLRDALSKSE